MSKKERLGSDPLSFIKDTRTGTEAAESKPAVEKLVKQDHTAKMETVKEEKSAVIKTETKKENIAVDIIKAEKLSMHIKQESSGFASISFDGEMTIYNVKHIKNLLVERIKRNSGIELELSKVSRIDTAGYQLITAAKKEAAEKGKTVRVINPAIEVKNIFNLYGENLT